MREGPTASSAFGSIKDWAQAGIPLGDAERTSMWRIGDWYLLGAKLFGRGACKRIVEADGWPGANYAVCRTAASIARRFPAVSRRLDIGFAHHQAVAAVHRIDRRRPSVCLTLLHANGGRKTRYGSRLAATDLATIRKPVAISPQAWTN